MRLKKKTGDYSGKDQIQYDIEISMQDIQALKMTFVNTNKAKWL